MKDTLLSYNLQFFAGEGEEEVESVEMPEAADQDNVEVENEVVEEEAPQQPDINAIAAAARRKAEESTRKQINAEFAERFKGYTNPITNEPITSYEDYLAAIDAQNKAQAEAQLKENGVDPSLIESLVNNHPAIKEANRKMQIVKEQETMQAIYNDVAALGQMDATIKSIDDVPAEVMKKAIQANMNLVDAYKIVNYGKVSETQQAALQQRAINQAKGKAHMTPVNGVASPDALAEIPSSELARWKETFPDKSLDELKKLYNKTL